MSMASIYCGLRKIKEQIIQISFYHHITLFILKLDVMNDLYTLGYKDEGPFFLSNFGQITRATRIHGVHNEEAIDRNTEAIIEQTDMQHAESDESQVQFSGHSMMLEIESNETQNIMTAHTKMQKDESDETQEKIASIISQLESISGEIESNTSGDATNADKITRAIQNLRLIVNP